VVLIDKYETVSIPGQKNDAPAAQTLAPAVNAPLTFDDLTHGNLTGKMVEIRTDNGSIFRGTLASVVGDIARINVEGSEIPVSRSVITKIELTPK
jgi:hypothetical protein